jgi:hypothetical protein
MLHLITNDKGKILDFMFTQGNVYDRDHLKKTIFTKESSETSW